MKRSFVILAAVGLPIFAAGQTLNPALLDSANEPKGVAWRPNFGSAASSRFAVEFAFGLNGYSWKPVNYDDSDAIVRQTIERTQPDFTPQQLNNTLWDMEYNGILNTFRNSSGNNERQMSPRLLRVRYRPMEDLPVDVSLGIGRSVALFFAKTQLQATGATVGVNQTDVIATAFTDHYFHLREIYDNWFIEQPQVPLTWKPLFVEVGAGYAPSPRVKFTGAFGFVPGAESSAQRWYVASGESGVSSSITDLSNARTTNQIALGVQLNLGSICWGLEQRWLMFLGDTEEYTSLGASHITTPSYFCMSLGYVW